MHTCEFCGKDFKKYFDRHIKNCKSNPNRIKRIVSEKTRQLLSQKMSLAFLEGRRVGWAINKDTNRQSYPEKWFIKNILKEHDLFSKYTIKEKMPFGKYFLDFAFLELKLDVEIDGQQHFRTNESIEHDKERDNYLINNGWRVYRIAWIEKSKNTQHIDIEFLNFLQTNNLYRSYNKEELLAYLIKKEPKYGSNEKFQKNRKTNYIQNSKIIVDKLLNSNIDFSKFGWVSEASKIIGISGSKVSEWMKKHMFEFYNDKCFKRACIMPRFERGEM